MIKYSHYSRYVLISLYTLKMSSHLVINCFIDDPLLHHFICEALIVSKGKMNDATLDKISEKGIEC